MNNRDMARRGFVAIGALFAATSLFAEPIRLDTETLALEFSEENGSLVGMTAKATGWVIHRRPELGFSWKLIVPMDDEHRNNPIFGCDQPKPMCETGDGFVRFIWDGITSERTGALDIRVIQEIRRVNACAVWYTRIENNSPYVVESVYSPVIGDVTRPAGAERMQLLQPGYGQAGEISLWPTFAANQGDYGSEYPTMTRLGTTASEPFVFIHDDNEGLYLGTMRRTEDTLTWFCELHPGFDDSISSHVPDMDEIGGKPVHIVCQTVHQPYVMPGESEDLAPIMLEAYQGGWERGADVYKRWISTFSYDAPIPAWAKEPHAWLELHINSPEDELRFRYTDLPKVAAECAEYGVKAIQLIGWNKGGQDQGNPSHDTDPRLGTYEELKAAIAEAEAMGVKIIIFSKFTWADRAEEWYRNDLIRYAVKDPYGDPYFKGGYKYFTPAQFLDINTKNFAVMCFGCEDYLALCEKEFAKVLGLGTVGILYDECAFRLPVLACFDTSHGHKYGWPAWRNDNLLIERFRKMEGVTDEFLIAGEGCTDWQFEQYNMSYFRTRVPGHIPMQRYVRPKVMLMVGVQGFNDRPMVNQCLMNKYIMSYEPYNFHGMLHDFPLTMEYGRRMDAFRTELRAWLWDGEYRGRVGAEVMDEKGGKLDTYSRFVAADGSSMLVIVNNAREAIRVKASFESGAAVRECRAVEEDGWHDVADGRIEIPALSAVVAR